MIDTDGKRLMLLTGIAAGSFMLAGCGGGSDGVELASTPPPASSSAIPPAPPTPPPPPIAPAHIGLVSNDKFVTEGIGDRFTRDLKAPIGEDRRPYAGPDRSENVEFSYDPASNSYQISLPGFQPGTLGLTGLSGSSGQVATSTTNQVTQGASPALQTVTVVLPVPGSGLSPLTYTSFGQWNGTIGTTADGREIDGEGLFAYGIPTKPGDVPVTGTGNYSAQILGSVGGGDLNPVGGDVKLTFDFASGTLAGSMHPQINDDWDGIFVDFGRYDFTQTNYAKGSTVFSGAFVVPGLPDATSQSFFEGAFTGPGATELLARWNAPFIIQGDYSIPFGTKGMLSGIWLGKKD